MIDIYLASPYTHPQRHVREERYKMACRAAAELIKLGMSVFSPIAHSHPIALHGDLDPMDHDLWLDQCLAFLPHCERIFILDIDGVKESRGVEREILASKEQGKQIWRVWFDGNMIKFRMMAIEGPEYKGPVG